MTLGAYPEISLKEARELREAARAQVARGIHPRKHRKQELLVKRLAEDRRVQGVFDQWLSHRSRTLQPGRQSTLGQIERIFRRDILPTLAKRSIYEITQADLLQVLGKIEAREALTTAEKCRSWLRQLFRFAMVKVPGLEKNPAQDLAVAALPKPPVAHNPFLQIADLPDLLQALRSYQGSPAVQMALRLLLLTGVRTGELRRATRDQFDLDRGLWTIPAVHVKQLHAKMHKKGLGPQDIPPYLIPLPTQAPKEAEAVSNVVNVETGTTVTITISTGQAPNRTQRDALMTSPSTKVSDNEQLSLYEAPGNLPLSMFASLAEKPEERNRH